MVVGLLEILMVSLALSFIVSICLQIAKKDTSIGRTIVDMIVGGVFIGMIVGAIFIVIDGIAAIQGKMALYAIIGYVIAIFLILWQMMYDEDV